MTWVTTACFLEMFALGSLADLPDLETLEAADAVGRELDDEVEAALGDAPGLGEEESSEAEGSAFDGVEVEGLKNPRRFSAGEWVTP